MFEIIETTFSNSRLVAFVAMTWAHPTKGWDMGDSLCWQQ